MTGPGTLAVLDDIAAEAKWAQEKISMGLMPNGYTALREIEYMARDAAEDHREEES